MKAWQDIIGVVLILTVAILGGIVQTQGIQLKDLVGIVDREHDKWQVKSDDSICGEQENCYSIQAYSSAEDLDDRLKTVEHKIDSLADVLKYQWQDQTTTTEPAGYVKLLNGENVGISTSGPMEHDAVIHGDQWD